MRDAQEPLILNGDGLARQELAAQAASPLRHADEGFAWRIQRRRKI
jgi:hypothetical protein